MSTTNNSCMLFDLPVEVLGEILQDWLELRSLVRVDSAICNNFARPILLKLFASNNCAQKRIVTLSTDSCAQWFTKRKLQITRVALSAASQEMSQCLRLQSKNIWYARCSGDDAIDLVSMNFCELTTFLCRDLVAKPNLNAALGYNTRLEDLRLENVKDLQLSHFENVFLPNLKVISLYGTVCDDALLSAVVHTTEALQHLDIGLCVNITDEGVMVMTKRCPLLRSVGLEELQITDIAIKHLTRLCPFIDNLHLRGNRQLTDTGFLSVARNLTQLRIIDLSYCDAITDLSLKHLAVYSNSKLETLYVLGLQQVRVNSLIGLLQQCRQLRELVLDCDIEPYCAEIVPHMRNLQSLLLYCVLPDQCVCMIAQHCKQLQDLAIPCSHKVESDLAAAAHQSAVEAGVGDARVMLCADLEATEVDLVYTDEGLLAMVDGLPNLQWLWAPTVTAVTDENQNKTLTHAVQRLWQRLRPGLQFVDDDRCWYISVLDVV